jgi:hypothetical protein
MHKKNTQSIRSQNKSIAKSNKMATTVAQPVQVDNKTALCSGCHKSFTKATLDKNSGVCGRCANKSKPDESNIPTILPAQVFPNTTASSQFQLPTMMANLSISNDGKTIAPQALTVAARLDQWSENTKKADPNNLKLKAAIDYVVATQGTAADLKRLEAVPNVHILSLEKAWETLSRIYMV